MSKYSEKNRNENSPHSRAAPPDGLARREDDPQRVPSTSTVCVSSKLPTTKATGTSTSSWVGREAHGAQAVAEVDVGDLGRVGIRVEVARTVRLTWKVALNDGSSKAGEGPSRVGVLELRRRDGVRDTVVVGERRAVEAHQQS